MNDNPVVISETSIRLSVSENTPIGTVLTSINATDRDIGLNGKIHYSISNGFPISSWMDYFRLGESTGILTLMNPLDFESEQIYSLTVQVRDLGENSIPQFVTIDLLVLDENDNSPQAFVTFLQPFYNESMIILPENTAVGQMLAHIALSDADSHLNGQLSWRIEEGEDLIGLKMFDEHSLLLFVHRSISSIVSNRFRLLICDHGQPSRSIHLDYLIHILDVNDHPPQFNSSIPCHRQINFVFNQSNEPLIQVKAIDVDSGDNARISYSILPPYDSIFTIDDQGQIFAIENLNESSDYYLQIMAIDHGSSIQLNSTKFCLISTLSSNGSNEDFLLFRQFWNNYSSLPIIVLIVFLFSIIFTLCLRRFIFNYESCCQKKKTYHLYVTIPRQNKRISTHQSDASSLKLLEERRPVSLSISTSTTCTSSETDPSLSSSFHRPTSTVVRLAEEEDSEI